MADTSHPELDELGREARHGGTGEATPTPELSHAQRFIGGRDELQQVKRSLDGRRR